MSQSISKVKPNFAGIRRRSYGYSFGSLIIAAFNLFMWVVLLMPAYLISDSATSASAVGLGFFLSVFLATNICALAMAVTAMVKSKFTKEMANYGFFANVVMIALNLSLFVH